MFFTDPAAAFSNIRRSIKPNGRLAFVCWRALEENPLDILPLRAASIYLPPPPARDPETPGPFAFANPDRVHRILERAGFQEIEITATPLSKLQCFQPSMPSRTAGSHHHFASLW